MSTIFKSTIEEFSVQVQCLRRIPSLVALLSLTVISGCGDSTQSVRAAEPLKDARPEPSVRDTESADENGDPRDLASFTNYGASQTIVTFESYEQMRDYADTSVLATVKAIRVVTPYEPPFISNGVMSVDIQVEAVLGGRFTDVRPGQLLSIRMPQSATPEVLELLQPRLDALTSSDLRFVFFLRAVSDESVPEGYFFEPMNESGPTGILAEWPSDGRITDLVAHDYIYRPAMRRGEELTGTSAPVEAEWTPSFEGSMPIGLTVEELLNVFAEPPGSSEVDPPAGWDRLEPLLVPAP